MGSQLKGILDAQTTRDVVYIKNEDHDSANQAIQDFDEAEYELDEEAEGLLADHEGVTYYSDAGFKIKQVTAPTIVQRQLSDLYHLSRTKYLKLDPEYQRDVVWDEGRASALIQSVLQGYFIPPIIFNVISTTEKLKDGKEILRHYRICVDGKQRLTSVQKFMEGDIGVLDSSTPPKKWFYCHPTVKGVEKVTSHHILPESTKEFFRTRMFCCYEYEDMPENVEETMFQLVQRGMPLTPAERMRALSTKWATFGKQYEGDYAKVILLSKQGRASGFRAVITMFCQILEVLHPSGNKRSNREGVGTKPVLQASPQVLTRLLCDDTSLTEAVKAKYKKVFDKYLLLVEQSTKHSTKSKNGFVVIQNSAFDPAPDYLREKRVGHVKTFSPLEQLGTAILLLVHMENRTDMMLLGDIKEMRYYLREHHKDLRLNNMCWTTVWEFIENDLIRRRGGEGVVLRRRAKDSREEEDNDEENAVISPTTEYTPRNTRQRVHATKKVDGNMLRRNDFISEPGISYSRSEIIGDVAQSHRSKENSLPQRPAATTVVSNNLVPRSDEGDTRQRGQLFVPLVQPRKRIFVSYPEQGNDLVEDKRIRRG